MSDQHFGLWEILVMSWYKKITVKQIYISSLIIIMGLSIFQFLSWREYSFEASYLEIKLSINPDDAKALRTLGSICNSLKKYSCAEKQFLRLTKLRPNDRSAIANYSISLALQQKWEEAKKYFISYFNIGGNAYDVMYWYARSVEATEGFEKSIKWYYYSLSVQPNKEAYEALLSHLLQLNRPIEAVSLDMAYQLLSSDKYKIRPDLKKKLNSFIMGSSDAIKLPSLNGYFFYMPIQIGNIGRVSALLVDTKAKKTVLSRLLLDDSAVSVPQKAKIQKHKILGIEEEVLSMKLTQIKVGAWSFDRQEVIVCTQCQPVLALKSFKNLSFSQSRQHNLQFLSVISK